MRLKKVMLWIVYLVVVVGMTLLITEIGARIVFKQILVPNPVREKDHRINDHGTHSYRVGENEYKTRKWKTSSLGLVDREYKIPKDPCVMRVVMLGDSFTEGLTQDEGMTIPQQLEKMIDDETVEVINLGTGGYGTTQELSKMNEIGWKLQPDLVILQLLLANDINDNLRSRGRRLPSALGGPTMKEEKRLAGKVDKFLRFSKVVRIMEKNTGVWNPMVRLFNGLPMVTPVETNIRVQRLFYIEHCLKNWYPLLEEGWQLVKQDVKALRDECWKRNISLVVFSIPGRTELMGGEEFITFQKAAGDHTSPDKYDLTKGTRVSKEMCEELGVPFINIRCDALTQQGMYWDYDGHFTNEGARVTATILYKGLSNMTCDESERVTYAANNN